MKRVGLVASSNGLGHARRIFQLALAFEIHGYSTTIFVTTKQIEKLLKEENLEKTQLNYCEIETHGIDGPTWLLNGGRITNPSYDVITKLQKCDFVISDNVLWPIKYSKVFALLGHFTWIDYWDKVGLNQFDLSLNKVYYDELQKLLDVKIWFQFSDFALDHILNLPKQIVPIKLLNYSSDAKFRNLIVDKSLVWISNGTTGLRRTLSSQQRDSIVFKVEERETFHLLEAKKKPILVIGRPGLGTIRDCLAAGIIFYPYWDELDPELTSNVKCLKRLSLIGSTYTEEIQIQSLGEQLISDIGLKNSWLNARSKIMNDTHLLIKQIVEFLD
jgi:hypothetical protein